MNAKPKITERTNPAGSISFCVDAGMIDNTRYRKFFKTKEEAKEHAKQISKKKREQGALAFTLTPKQQVEAAQAYRKLQAVESSLPEAVDFFLKHAKPKNGCKLTSELVEEFLGTKERSNVKPKYLKSLVCEYNKFCKTFGTRKINEISRAEIEQWLHAQPFKPVTVGNYIRDLGMLFRFASQEGYCSENPVERIAKPRFADADVEFYTVSQASRLLFAAQINEPSLITYLAIGFFAGLRSSELEQLDWNEIQIHNDVIEVTSAKAKTSSRRFVEISENLKSWLALVPYENRFGCIVQKGWRDRLQKLGKIVEEEKDEDGEGEGGFEMLRNGLRHSFASYHYALHQNASKTATQLGHTGTIILFKHYKGLATAKNANSFWGILPNESVFMLPPKPLKNEDRANVVALESFQKELPALIAKIKNAG